MALDWLTVLRSLPWSEVIGNAPRIAEAARKLWNNSARAPATTPAEATPQARIAALEQELARLNEKMQASSALIDALAEQNQQLVARVEVHRRALRWLGAAAALALALALAVAAGALWPQLGG